MAKELLCTGESCKEYWSVQTDLHVQEASKFNSLTWVGIVTYNEVGAVMEKLRKTCVLD